MERMRFLSKTLIATFLVLVFGARPGKAQEDDGFTMSSGALLGGANGTQGA